MELSPLQQSMRLVYKRKLLTIVGITSILIWFHQLILTAAMLRIHIRSQSCHHLWEEISFDLKETVWSNRRIAHCLVRSDANIDLKRRENARTKRLVDLLSQHFIFHYHRSNVWSQELLIDGLKTLKTSSNLMTSVQQLIFLLPGITLRSQVQICSSYIRYNLVGKNIRTLSMIIIKFIFCSYYSKFRRQ